MLPLVIDDGNTYPLPGDRALNALATGTGLELNNNSPLHLPAFSPVAAGYGAGSGGMILARADSWVTMPLCGILIEECPPNAAALVQRSGIVEGTEVQWSVIANTGYGLQVGAIYWLSPAIAGRITSTAPNHIGDYLIQVGRALSPTRLLLDITLPIGL